MELRRSQVKEGENKKQKFYFNKVKNEKNIRVKQAMF